MDINKMSKSELKTLSYTDIAFLILKQGKKLNTLQLFNKVCELLELDPTKYTDKIGDFYTSLSTDCRFLILEDANWDIRDKHVVKLEIEDDEDEEEIEEEIEDTEEEEEEPEETELETDPELDDELEDDIEEEELEDLSIIDEEDIDK